MTAVFSTPREESGDPNDDGDTLVAGTPVVVRRRAGLAALIGAAASAVAIAYLWRASQTMTALDWSLCAAMALVACYYLASLIDARTPLAVADDLGVRIRLGDEWTGLPWDAIRQVSVHPRRGLLRDGRIVFSPHSLARAVDGLDGKAKRHAALNQKMYGAVLAVPVGVTTRVSTGGGESAVDQLAALSLGSADVIEVAPEPERKSERQPKSERKPKSERQPKPERKPKSERQPKPERQPKVRVERKPRREKAKGKSATDHSSTGAAVDAEVAAIVEPIVISETAPSTAEPAPAVEPTDRPRRRVLGGFATIVSRVGKERGAEPYGDPAPAPASGTSPLRATRRALRAEVTRDAPATLGNVALHGPEETDEPDETDETSAFGAHVGLERGAPAGADRVRPISQLGAAVEPLVIDDFVTEPAYNPVIGPELTAARNRLGLSVDELADRTRIRPHVIESIEVDDFAPCGGDFYARGHLRTLARVLGQDPEPSLASFEERYATAPVNARRVFEAELATGMRGSMRSTIGRPSWGLLIGAVLTLILVWGVVRFFSAEPAELVQNPVPVLNGSAGLSSDPKPGKAAPPAKPVRVTFVAAHADSGLVVRNGKGRIVFSGELLLGQKQELSVVPPVRVRATDAGAVEVSVGRRDRGVVGQLGESGNRVFR